MKTKIPLRRVIEKEVEEFLDRAFYDEALQEWAKKKLMEEYKGVSDDLALITKLDVLVAKARDAVGEEFEATWVLK